MEATHACVDNEGFHTFDEEIYRHPGCNCERVILAAWWVGQYDEAAELNAELLANPRLPEHIRATVLRNETYRRAA